MEGPDRIMSVEHRAKIELSRTVKYTIMCSANPSHFATLNGSGLDDGLYAGPYEFQSAL